MLGTAVPVAWAEGVPIDAPPLLPPSPPASGRDSPFVTTDVPQGLFVPEDPDWVEYHQALHARWQKVGHFYDDDGPFYGVDDKDAYTMDEDWDFSVWGDPDHDRTRNQCLTSLNMTLQSVVWQLEQDATGTNRNGITHTRRAQMSRFIYLLRQYIQSQCDAPDVATGGSS